MPHIQAEAFTSCKKNRLKIQQMRDLSRRHLKWGAGGHRRWSQSPIQKKQHNQLI
jgi:hypothetical protein